MALLPIDLYDQGSVWLEVSDNGDGRVSLGLVDSGEEGYNMTWSTFRAKVNEVRGRPRTPLVGSSVECEMTELVAAITRVQAEIEQAHN